MIELFPDISDTLREAAEFWIQAAMSLDDPKDAALEFNQFVSSLKSEREKEYVNFVLKIKMAELKEKLNESIFD